MDNPKYYNLLFAILQFDKSIYNYFNLDKANPNYLVPISPIYFFQYLLINLINISIRIN